MNIKFICSSVLSLVLTLTPFQILGETQTPRDFNSAEIQYLVQGVSTARQFMAIMKANMKPQEFAEVAKFLKGEGFDENSPMPKLKVKGTSVHAEGLPKGFDMSRIAKGEIGNGSSTWKHNPKHSPAENLKALVSFIKNGSYKYSLIQSLLPLAEAKSAPGGNEIAGLSMIAASLGGFFYSAYMAIVGISVLVGTGLVLTGASILALAAGVAAVANQLWNAGIRIGIGGEVDCDENGNLVYTLGGKNYPVESDVGKTVFGLERHLMQAFCSRADLRDKLAEAISKTLEAGSKLMPGSGSDKASTPEGAR